MCKAIQKNRGAYRVEAGRMILNFLINIIKVIYECSL